jgi:glycosyltransferase involved in cell wall biosynthesis
MPGTGTSVSVVVPAFNAEQTIGKVVRALLDQEPRPYEVSVVDDGSTDRTAEIAAGLDVRVVSASGVGSAGGARNLGWDEAKGGVVLFLDSDAVPAPGFAAGLARALAEFPGAIIGCARTFTARTSWGWVAHLQGETFYLPLGEPRKTSFVSSYCMAVPRLAPLRWDESYGGEDGLFCVDALDAGLDLVFDPRFHAVHDHDRRTFADLRSQQRRLAYGLARVGAVQREGLRRRVFSRIPIHYFALVRLVPIYRRLRQYPELRAHFLRLLPLMVVAEWTLGASALRYALKRPALRGQDGGGFR